MEGLEILDLSKNNITAFPEVPNKLINLKVLSLTHNGIYTLPTYMTSFENLKVFKVASNPIEWPVRHPLLQIHRGIWLMSSRGKFWGL
jgi:Leucine-rich repeat (LRR) protein